MAQLDLETTYVSLDGKGDLNQHPAEGFWQTVGSNPDVLGTLVTGYVSATSWRSWEMHPAGDEVMVLVDGSMAVILDEPGGERRVEMAPGATLIVPKGIWHRVEVSEPSRFISITYFVGTTRRPL